MNTRRAAALLREIADLDDEAARIASDRAERARKLAEALEDPEEAATPPQDNRPRGRGAMLLPPKRPPSELDAKRARDALRNG